MRTEAANLKRLSAVTDYRADFGKILARHNEPEFERLKPLALQAAKAFEPDLIAATRMSWDKIVARHHREAVMAELKDADLAYSSKKISPRDYKNRLAFLFSSKPGQLNITSFIRDDEFVSDDPSFRKVRRKIADAMDAVFIESSYVTRENLFGIDAKGELTRTDNEKAQPVYALVNDYILGVVQQIVPEAKLLPL